jgi:nifR3 family TIM-barrel protein
VNTYPDFFVGQIPVYGDLILSPMDGFSDLPFRSLCRELGSAMSYTEFVNAMDVVHPHPHLDRKLTFLPEERPIVFQLFDDDPDRLLEAARRLLPRHPDMIDINMGCSARTVSGRGAGAGLLRTPEKIAEIFQKLTGALDIPVTGKIRLGWDADSLNYRLVARIIEENGGALIAVHGRTRAQGYGGRADWDAIAEVKRSVSIPVIGNGDVRCVADIERLKAYTGCQGVMIGRGAIGNPWIFSRMDREQVPPEAVRQVVLLHLERMSHFYHPEYSLVLFRKHLAQYISPYPLDPDIRKRLMTATNKQEFIDLLSEMIFTQPYIKST